MVRLDPQYHLIFGGGGDLLATPNVARMEQAIAAISPADADQFQRFLDDNRVKLARFRPTLESAFLNWRNLCTWSLLKLLPILRPWRSLDSELGRYFRDPRIRLAFSFQSKYLGMSPFNCPVACSRSCRRSSNTNTAKLSPASDRWQSASAKPWPVPPATWV